MSKKYTHTIHFHNREKLTLESEQQILTVYDAQLREAVYQTTGYPNELVIQCSHVLAITTKENVV